MKVKCSWCGFENISGSDHCEKCLHTLTPNDLPKPTKDTLQKKIMTESVADFISKTPPILMKSNASVQELVDKMHAFPMKGCVLVSDDGKKLLGIISIRDVLLKVAGVIPDLNKVTVDKIMTRNPECLEKDAPLSFALHKMFIGKFRHVPVLDNGKPIGVVSTRDLIEYLCRK